MSGISINLKSIINSLRRFITEKDLPAKTIIASFAITSIIYFGKEVGINGLPEAISLYIASGVGIESLGILLGELLDKNNKTLSEDDILTTLNDALENGDLDRFASHFLTRDDLQKETGLLLERTGILEGVITGAFQDHENNTVKRILEGVQQFRNLATQEIIDKLEDITINLSETATRDQANIILEELKSIRTLIENRRVALDTQLNTQQKLSDDDNRRLNRILRNLPNTYDTRRRINFVDGAGLISFSDRLEFDGTSTEFSQQLVRVLYDYGRLPDGQLALCKLLVYIQDLIPGQPENLDFLNYLIRKLKCDIN